MVAGYDSRDPDCLACQIIMEAEREKQEAVFWYRPHSDGQGYDGPINDSQIEAVRRNSGAWVPLYAAQPVTAPVRLTDKQIAESHANEIMNCLQDPCDKSESVMPMPHDVNRFVRAIETAVLRANGFNIDHPEHALELVGLRGCTGGAERGEDQPAEAGDSNKGEQQ